MDKLSRNQKGFTAVEGLLIILILVLIGGAGWLVYKNHHKAVTSSASVATTKISPSKPAAPFLGFQLPKNWQWYTNAQYGFKFAYPDTWGSPSVSVSQGSIGSAFDINFYPAPAYTGAMTYNSRTPINLLFQTDNYSDNTCNDGGCRTATASPTKSSIQSVLNSIANGSYNAQTNGTIVAHDTTSYDIVNTQLPNGGDTTDALIENKIVNLSVTGVSGVYIAYDIVNAPTTCKSDALSNTSQQLCINQDDVNTISQFANSIETN
jgi:hypothetical protein